MSLRRFWSLILIFCVLVVYSLELNEEENVQTDGDFNTSTNFAPSQSVIEGEGEGGENVDYLEKSTNESTSENETQRLQGSGEEVQITDKELKKLLETIKERDLLLVKFFAKWCEFSQELEPTYAAIARAFPTLPVFSLDASKFNGLNYRLGIFGFPRVILFEGPDNLRKYNGNRTFQSISEFVKRHTKLEPIEGVEVIPLPVGRETPEADMYLYLSAAFLFSLLLYAMWVVCSTRLQRYRSEGEEHDKAE